MKPEEKVEAKLEVCDSSEFSECHLGPLEKCRPALLKVCERPWKVDNVIEEGHKNYKIIEGDRFRFAFDRDGFLTSVLHKKKDKRYYQMASLHEGNVTPNWFTMDDNNIVIIHCLLSHDELELVFTFNIEEATFNYMVGKAVAHSSHGRGGGN